MTRVLFVCTHNSARSQMAEAYLEKLGGGAFEVESAGLEPGKLNPYVVRALQEDGIDISGKQTHSVFDYSRRGPHVQLRHHGLLKGGRGALPSFPGARHPAPVVLS